MLCGCMWGLTMYTRPPWTTGSLVPASFLCGIAAAVLIWKGGQWTKKVEDVENKLRTALDIPPPEPGSSGGRRSSERAREKELARADSRRSAGRRSGDRPREKVPNGPENV